MAWIPAGTFTMGSDRFYPEEAPARSVAVAGFWIDVAPVTNARFAAFVEETGYVTIAERSLDEGRFAHLDAAQRAPGSLVFRAPPGPVPLDDPARWWSFVPGACWRCPEGPGSDLDGRQDHPVVHVAFADACAYAAWAGRDLPTEMEWERAGRGGEDDALYPWGNDLAPGGSVPANVWVGEFPWLHRGMGARAATTPVHTYPPNAYGLFDAVGNVWEWTSGAYHDAQRRVPAPLLRRRESVG